MDHYQLPKMSDEQKAAVIQLVNKNVIIESVAGSGKTTTILYIATVFKTRKTLLLTYNAKLKMETREKVKLLNITNLEVHSYHSFCVKYIDRGCTTDAGIIRYLQNDQNGQQGGFGDEPSPITPPITLPTYDMIIMDESQDMTPIYYDLAYRIQKQSPRAYICVLGDQFQSIYTFNGADKRFITFADRVFRNDYEWERKKLSTSYRITRQMADFINKCAFGYEHMQAVKDGARPRYLFAERSLVNVMEEIKMYMTNYSVNDIFILAPSVRGTPTSAVNRLSNLLSKEGIPVYMPNDDHRKLDEEVLRGKIVFSTYHQAKGLERKVVITMGFDMSYYFYFNKQALPDVCPNEIYVALTRASERMTVVHGHSSEYLPFLNVDRIEETCDVVGIASIPTTINDRVKGIRVTDLIRHISPTSMSVLMNLLTVETIIPPGEIINIPAKTAQENPFGDVLYEEVSDITGTAVPAYYQYMITGDMDILRALPPKVRRGLRLPLKSPAHLLEIANNYNCLRANLVFKCNQIQNYNWLAQDKLEQCVARLIDRLPTDAMMETGFKLEICGKVINGFVDAISDGILWELKCVNEITDEHILQTAIYALMHQLASGEVFAYYLYNVVTGELKQIHAEQDKLIKLVRVLIHCKYHATSGTSDADFLAMIEKIRGGVVEKTKIVCDLCTAWKERPPTVEILRMEPKQPPRRRAVMRNAVRTAGRNAVKKRGKNNMDRAQRDSA